MTPNKKIAVVYRSKTGFTENYAQWIAEELGCDLLKAKSTKIDDLMKYDTIIYGAGLYAVGISGIKLITKNIEFLKDKELIVFAVGASPAREEALKDVYAANIKGEFQDRIKFFYLRGGFDYTRLSPFYKLLMTLKKIQLKRLKNPDADAKGMLASYSHPVDFTKKKNIEPIIHYVKELS